MPEQNDYGTRGDGTALVPGTLTAYRHFALLHGGSLGPMNDPLRGVYQRDRSEDGVFKAACLKRPSWVLGYRPGSDPAHDSPDVNCTCGFYAHYDERGDFYQQGMWTAAPASYISSMGGTYHVFSGISQSRSFLGSGMVRAVVELSGRIVMGRVGVRAQKMKVKALAVDWTKFYDQPFAPSPTLYDGSEGHALDFRVDIRAWYEYWCSTAAARLGAEYHTDMNEMLKEHPKPDLSALGIAPAKPKAWGGIDAFFQYQFTLTAADVEKISQALGLPASTSKKAPQGVVPDSPLARVIEARKNRPAPPGTGIDRRKRKL